MRRRAILTILTGAALFLCQAVPARAVETQAAVAFVQTAIKEAMGEFAGKNLAAEVSRPKLDALVDRYIDRRQIAEAILGRYWPRATAEQQGKFENLVLDYAMSGFGGGLSDLSAEQKITVTGSAVDGDRVVVHSVSTEPGDDPTPIDWVVGTVGARMVIVDVFIEGVSPIKTMRDDFTAVLRSNGGGIDGLMAAMQKKMDANKAATASK